MSARTETRTVTVAHIKIVSDLPFAEVRLRLSERLPGLDPRIIEQLSAGDHDSVGRYDSTGPALSIFMERDHGALLQIVGRRRNAIQYEIGNPLTASKLTRHRLAAGLYAPLRVVLYEDEHGKGVFEYDKPSSLLGQFGDDRVAAVSSQLDVALEQALLCAADAA